MGLISTGCKRHLVEEFTKKQNVNKIYCEKCDSVFGSREKFEKHFEKHSSSVSCESCPLDLAIGKLVNLFRRKNKKF